MIPTLKVLKTGLAEAKRRISEKRDELLRRLKGNEKLSQEEEAWLDHGEGNLIEEETLIDALENASHYERGFSRLNSQQKTLVEKLKELEMNVRGVVLPGNKRKSDPSLCPL